MFTRRSVVDDRGVRISPVHLTRWSTVLGGHAVSRDLRNLMRPRTSARAAFRYNGWTRLLLMMFGGMLGNLVVIVPLFLFFVRYILYPGASFGGTVRLPALGAGYMVGAGLAWMVCVVVVATCTHLPMARMYWYPVIVDAAVAEGHCGSCGYPLLDSASDADGCTVCPECGAAWKVPMASTPATGGKPPVSR